MIRLGAQVIVLALSCGGSYDFYISFVLSSIRITPLGEEETGGCAGRLYGVPVLWFHVLLSSYWHWRRVVIFDFGSPWRFFIVFFVVLYPGQLIENRAVHRWTEPGLESPLL